MTVMNFLKVVLAIMLYVGYGFLIYIQPVLFVSLFVTIALFIFNVKMNDDVLDLNGR